MVRIFGWIEGLAVHGELGKAHIRPTTDTLPSQRKRLFAGVVGVVDDNFTGRQHMILHCIHDGLAVRSVGIQV